jgi:hypothetical protein
MGKKKEQYPKITKKSLDFLDEEERNREVTFQSFDVFGRTYTESSVKGRIEDDLRRIPSLVNRYKYLSKAKSHIKKMKHNSYLKEELIDKELSNFDKKRLDMVDAYFPIKVWIEKQYDQIEKQIKKEKSNKEKKKQLEDSQTTFEINEKYSHLLHDMWELMIDRKSNMIAYDTKFDDFEKVFLKVEEKDIINPIHWIGKKATLLRLFDDLMNENILQYISIGKQTSSKYTNPLDICFVKDKKCNKFLKWKSSYAHLNGSVARKTTNQKTIDMIIQLFKADTKID